MRNIFGIRPAVAAALISLVAGLVGVGTASSARAASCSSNTLQLNDGSAAMTITVQRYCPDGKSHITGTVRDVKCDARAAHGTIKFWNGDNVVWYRREFPEATNGCNTSASFNYSSTNAGPKIYAYVVAYNGGPTQSSGDGGYV